MIRWIKKQFTKWYYKKGYKINSIPSSPTFEFYCPKVVKFFARVLFSYDDYIWEMINNLEAKK